MRPSSGRGRAARGDANCFTLTAHTSHLWSAEKGRVLCPNELLLSQGFAAEDQLASILGVPRHPCVDGVAHGVAVRMAGNAMHVPTVGCVLLWAMLFTQPK